MQSIISSNIQRRAARVVAKGGIRPQYVAHILWVILPNALLQVISCSLQCRDSLVRLHLLVQKCKKEIRSTLGAATGQRAVAASVPVHFSNTESADVSKPSCYDASQSVEPQDKPEGRSATDLQQNSTRRCFQLSKCPQCDSNVLRAKVIQAAVDILGHSIQQLSAWAVCQDGKGPHDVGNGLGCEIWQCLCCA